MDSTTTSLYFRHKTLLYQGTVTTRSLSLSVTASVCVECLIGKQNKPILFQVVSRHNVEVQIECSVNSVAFLAVFCVVQASNRGVKCLFFPPFSPFISGEKNSPPQKGGR